MAPRISVEHNTFELQGSQPLFAQSWIPSSEIRGTIGIVHGLGEHSSRYRPFAELLATSGYRVFAYDQRGHGQTSGKRGDAPSYDVLLDDVETLLAEMSAADDLSPKFLFGQSFGGALVLNLALRRQPSLNGIIVSSPLLRPTHPPARWKDIAGRCLQRVCPSFQFRTGIEAEQLSHDLAVAKAYKADALVHDQVSARIAVAMLDAGQWAIDHADQLSTPTLLMHGTSDPITSSDATVEFAERASECCTLEIFSDLYHELHWERESDEVFEVVLNWLDH
ncbi:MAG: lysophospholipase [Planctomycetes bacterium]|nr:lysophospholipase [Planctomycetota bacterium]